MRATVSKELRAMLDNPATRDKIVLAWLRRKSDEVKQALATRTERPSPDRPENEPKS